MPDGTIKHTNPLTGLHAWSVPGRGKRPLAAPPKAAARRPLKKEVEDYCDFCEANYLQTPPEKERIIHEKDHYTILERVPARQLHDTTALFRRVANLFEIVTFDYWEKNYGYKPSPADRKWKEEYLSTEEGKNHILTLLDKKLARLNRDDGGASSRISNAEKLKMADAFFGGCHEVIIAKRHLTERAGYDDQPASSGDLSQEEHYHYFKLTIRAIEEIHRNNPHARYVAVFQNWLRPAGASFEHLHKQLVALDQWGHAIEREMEKYEKNRNIYNEAVVNFAASTDRIIIENDHAIGLADIGHEYPTIAVYSRSANVRPYDHGPEELRGMSDVIHACHMAMGRELPSNEQWYYTPRDAAGRLPWHILIKWRVNITAGFEGGTNIYINPISPFEMKDLLAPRLHQARDEGVIGNPRIAEECTLEHDPLKYNG